jgi:hypothetical protein
LLLAVGVRASEAAFGEVADLVGRVQVVRSTRIVALANGEPVFPGDIVRTGEDGRVLIVCLDGLRLLIGSGSEVALRVYLADRSHGTLQAAFGLLRGIVRLIGGDSLRRQWIAVDTRTAVASVRSTEWLVEATQRGTGVLAVAGVVEVQGLAGGLVILQPGQGTDVPPGGLPRPATRWGDARRRDALARTTL